MNSLPNEHITFKTSLAQPEIVRRLNENTEPEKVLHFGFLYNKKPKAYEGVVTEKYFPIKRITGYGNLFLPANKGSIKIRSQKINLK